DSKDPRDAAICAGAPSVDACLTSEAAAFFAGVTAGLDAAGVPWKRNPRLVRGLDYYRHTAFEFVTDRLGAQGTVIAGGRYDGLMESLGGPYTPAVGWAAGIERLAMMIDAPSLGEPIVAVIADKSELQFEANHIAAHLRRGGSAVVIYFSGNAKKQTDRARREGVDAILYVRNSERTRESIHLSHSPQSTFDGTTLLLDTLGRMPDEYRQMSGDNLQ